MKQTALLIARHIIGYPILSVTIVGMLLYLIPRYGIYGMDYLERPLWFWFQWMEGVEFDG